MGWDGEFTDLIIIGSIILGAINCFFGYRIFKIVLGILGFILGASMIGGIVYSVTEGQEIVTLIAALVGGFVGAAGLVLLYFVGVFVLGAMLGVLLGTLITPAFGSTLQLVIKLLLAVIGGIFALIFQKFMIILATSLAGSWSVVSGVFYYVIDGFNPYRIFQHPERFSYLDMHFFIMLLCWIVLGIACIFIQYKITSKKPAKKAHKSNG